MSPRTSIVFHSSHGHTRRLALAIAAASDTALVEIDAQGQLSAEDWARLDASDVLIFGSPTCMGNVSWQFKRFQDATATLWTAQRWRDKLAAGFTHSAGINGDKLATLGALFTFSQQHGMVWTGTGLMPANVRSSGRDDVNYLAAFSGLMAATPADVSHEGMTAGDLETARLFGERVRAVARRRH
ncbi:flavodoxin family protein [Luteimonas sp. gir]|uniref:flavodoxin family protein n=1 Tax=Luteimonas sp. gir TaxID=3127960 RepID=UPI003075C711